MTNIDIIPYDNSFLYNEKIDLVNSLFKARLIGVKDYNEMSLLARKTIINLSKMAKININKNFKFYE